MKLMFSNFLDFCFKCWNIQASTTLYNMMSFVLTLIYSYNTKCKMFMKIKWFCLQNVVVKQLAKDKGIELFSRTFKESARIVCKRAYWSDQMHCRAAKESYDTYSVDAIRCSSSELLCFSLGISELLLLTMLSLDLNNLLLT